MDSYIIFIDSTDVREYPDHLIKYIQNIYRSTTDFNPSC